VVGMLSAARNAGDLARAEKLAAVADTMLPRSGEEAARERERAVTVSAR
jgi:hypothetical protein